MNQVRDKIIVLEADPAARASLKETLEAANFEVFASWESGDAVETLNQSGADIILLGTDIGEHVVREILATVRGSSVTGGIRVIFLTGPAPAERADALDLGADDAISRPWESAEILARIRVQ